VRIGLSAGVTDTGRRRLRNEDAFICEPPLFAVADGMGGARAGEIAAGLAAAALEEAGAETRGAEGIAVLIAEANRRIWERSLTDPETAGMGTTVTAALVDAAAATVAIGHVGDSRAYRLRDGALEQLTVDHSLVAELVQSGVLTPEEAERHPQRSAITRALGTEPTVDVDAFTVDAVPGDVFLICSDGLSSMLADDEVARLVATAEGDVAHAAEALVHAANARGGEDNVTVVLFELLGDAVEAEETALSAPEPTAAEPDVEEAPEDHLETAPTASQSTSSESGANELEASDPSLRRHGAGPGGRAAALLLIAVVLVVGALALYWEFAR
jgi:serine/threonine protein phosphatase PrpC